MRLKVQAHKKQATPRLYVYQTQVDLDTDPVEGAYPSVVLTLETQHGGEAVYLLGQEVVESLIRQLGDGLEELQEALEAE